MHIFHQRSEFCLNYSIIADLVLNSLTTLQAPWTVDTVQVKSYAHTHHSSVSTDQLCARFVPPIPYPILSVPHTLNPKQSGQVSLSSREFFSIRDHHWSNHYKLVDFQIYHWGLRKTELTNRFLHHHPPHTQSERWRICVHCLIDVIKHAILHINGRIYLKYMYNILAVNLFRCLQFKRC